MQQPCPCESCTSAGSRYRSFCEPFAQLEVSEAIALTDFFSDALYLRVLESNKPAQAMYAKMGYNTMWNPGGEPPGVFLLQKRLKIR